MHVHHGCCILQVPIEVANDTESFIRCVKEMDTLDEWAQRTFVHILRD